MRDSHATSPPTIMTDADPRLQIMARIRAPLYLFDTNAMRIVWANDCAVEFWQADSVNELCSRDLNSGVSATVKLNLAQVKKHCFDNDSTLVERWTVYPKELPKTADFLMSPFVCAEGKALLLIQIQEFENTPDNETLYRTTALMHTSTMISAYDVERKLVYCNTAAREAIPGTMLSGDDRLVHSADAQAISTTLSKKHYCNMEAQVHTTQGIRWHSLHIERCTNPTSGKLMYLATELDITEQIEAKEQAHQLAFMDSLTNLPNRAALMNQFDELLSGDQPQQFATLFLDLDRFKNINDSLGHAVGDLLLIQVAERLSNTVRDEGFVYRLAGDEFVILITDEDVSAASSNIANRILASMAKLMYVTEHQLRIRTSIGISLYPQTADTANSLLEQADTAMYAAKASQCGYCFFDSRMSMTSARDIKKRIGLENDLQKAIENDEFELYYQPKIACDTLSVCGVEALVRWHHPEFGTLAPDKFIGIAEESGQIVELGDWVLRDAMRQQRQWQDQGILVPVSINISARQFESSELDTSIVKALQLNGCDPRMIELEVTESMLAGDPDGVYEVLQRISALGIRLTLDDFGTGYSNLAYLQNYPLDSMKIDRLFLSDRRHTMLLRTILNMGKTLGLEIVAEGVETAPQVDWLIDQGCDQMQGFYFSKPKPVEEITEYLRGNDAKYGDQQSSLHSSHAGGSGRMSNAANDEDHAA